MHKLGDWQSHPYRVEGMPWLKSRHLERILLARGAYVAAVAKLETGLTELAIRLSKHDDYFGLRETFPSRREDRLKFLILACDGQGPLGDKSRLTRCFVRRFERYLRLRDILAHGDQSATSGSGDDDTLIRFKDYFAAKGGAEVRIEPINLLDLEMSAIKACRSARAWAQFYPTLDDRIAKLDF